MMTKMVKGKGGRKRGEKIVGGQKSVWVVGGVVYRYRISSIKRRGVYFFTLLMFNRVFIR